MARIRSINTWTNKSIFFIQKKCYNHSMNKLPTSEIRKCPLTGDWSIIAPSRSNRHYKKSTDCPFCNILEQEEPVLIMNNGKVTDKKSKWSTIVIPNKFPAMQPLIESKTMTVNEYTKVFSPGYHELVITSDHNKNIAQLSLSRIKELFDCYQYRISSLKNEKSVNYIFIFQNHGERAGASQHHPHSQIITLPFIDKELKSIINESKKYYNKNKKCLHCEIIKNEIQEKKRILFENESFLAYIPFAPKFLFQVIVTPKKHQSLFEEISENEKNDLAQVFKLIAKKYNKNLNNPAYNFYLHNSPCDKKDYNYFHWYFAFMPRMSNLAGFEISANMEIISIMPEDQVNLLK